MNFVVERLRVVVALLVPPGHGEWIAAHGPGCVVKIDDAGDLGSDPVEEIGEEVRWLRDGAPPA